MVATDKAKDIQSKLQCEKYNYFLVATCWLTLFIMTEYPAGI